MMVLCACAATTVVKFLLCLDAVSVTAQWGNSAGFWPGFGDDSCCFGAVVPATHILCHWVIQPVSSGTREGCSSPGEVTAVINDCAMCWQCSGSVLASFGRSFRDSTTEVVQQGVGEPSSKAGRGLRFPGCGFGVVLQQQHQHTQYQQPCARAVESIFTVIAVNNTSP